MDKRRVEWGQGLLEMAVILPILLIMLLGVVEIGLALRSYLVVVNANREGARFASRGQFSDQFVGARVVNSAGTVRAGDPPTDVPFLRTRDFVSATAEANAGIIVTHILMDSDGDVYSHTVVVTGVHPSGEGGLIGAEQSVISDTAPARAQLVSRHRESTESISTQRAAAMYDPVGNHIVVVETFFQHHPLWGSVDLPWGGSLFLPDPWIMHAQAEMRVLTDRQP